jgi:hypothetical protein
MEEAGIISGCFPIDGCLGRIVDHRDERRKGGRKRRRDARSSLFF